MMPGKSQIWMAALLALSGWIFCESSSPAPVFADAPVVSASLFKNGLALITRELTIPPHKDSVTVVADVPPIHGTFWIDFDGAARIESSQKSWQETRIAEDNHLDMKQALINLPGQKVRLTLSGGEHVIGTIKPYSAVDTSFLPIKTDKGLVFLETGRIERVSFDDPDVELEPVKKEIKEEMKKDVLNFVVDKSHQQRSLRFSYLCRGVTWAPAYRLDLLGEKRGKLFFQGVIKNEVLEFRQTEVTLVSGFPAIFYEKTLSPLHRAQSLDIFFNSLNVNRVVGQNVAMQQIAYNFVSDQSDITESGAAAQDLDSDLHLRPVGSLDLKAGDAALLELGEMETTLERVVEWTIPESRDREGRYQSNWRNHQPGSTPDELWDTLIVSNPFDFPMTTAPFTVYQQGQMISQNLSYWTARGQKARVRSGKALNIGTEVKEQEIENSRKRIDMDGDDYQQVEIRCDINLVNRRSNPQTVIVKRSVWGKIQSLIGKGEKRQLPEGAGSQNPRSEVEWRFELAGGQRVRIGFVYLVLTDI